MPLITKVFVLLVTTRATQFAYFSPLARCAASSAQRRLLIEEVHHRSLVADNKGLVKNARFETSKASSQRSRKRVMEAEQAQSRCCGSHPRAEGLAESYPPPWAVALVAPLCVAF